MPPEWLRGGKKQTEGAKIGTSGAPVTIPGDIDEYSSVYRGGWQTVQPPC
jgi:hypothetical protein